MKTMRHSLRMRMTALLLALVCVVGLLPISAMVAGTDTIKLERFGMSGVSYTSASLGTCTLHQMYYDYGGETTVGFCGTKGGGMGASLIGQTWGSPQEIADPSVKLMMAYYYAHSTGTFTDQARALGVDNIWDSGYTWYMNAWVQAILWRYPDLLERALAMEDYARPNLITVKGLGRDFAWRDFIEFDQLQLALPDAFEPEERPCSCGMEGGDSGCLAPLSSPQKQRCS